MSFRILPFVQLLLLLLVFSSCDKDQLPEPTKPIDPTVVGPPLQLIHLAHTRMNSNAAVNEALIPVDYSAYDVVMLGGDLALDTSVDRPTMDTMQALFDLQSDSTLLALGNHDYADLALVEEYTGRPAFYTYTQDKLTFLVLDTQDNASSMVGDQLEMIQAVLDTIEESTHLILLHHKLIWMYGNDELEDDINMTANGVLGDCFHCLNPNNFYNEVYPLLVDVKERGIEVFCIAGDLGFRAKTFYHLTPEGIHLMGSGMDTDKADNPVILFEYDRQTASLEWTFTLLEDL